MKKLLVILMMVLGMNLFADAAVYDTNTGEKMEYHVIAVAVNYNDIDQITQRGSLIIQDERGRYYNYAGAGHTNFYSAVAYGYTGINQDKLEYLDVDNIEELVEIARKYDMYILPLNEALEIIENNR